MQKKNAILANIEMLIVSIIWGSTFIIVKKSLIDVNAITLNCYRFLLAALMIGLALVFLRRNPWRHLKEGMVLGFLLFASFAAQTLGLYSISAANSGFIVGLFVVFVPILSILLGYEKLRLNIFIAVVLVCVGLWSITGGISGFNGGAFLTLISAIIFALYILYADRVVKRCDVWVLNFQQFFIVAFMSLVSVLAFKLPLNVASHQTAFWILYLALFATILAFAIQLRAQKTISPIACAIILSLEPVFAAIFAWTVGGEQFTAKSVIGGALIVIAIIVSQVSGIKKIA
ncbi:MAG: hypothetical protein ACD_21C00251G0009 [uncultured bacterium]|nr:MAG: hypothetical protein ACD_21C00251G0009 [uncultured bacterium]